MLFYQKNSAKDIYKIEKSVENRQTFFIGILFISL